METFKRAAFGGLGSYVPRNRRTNAYLESISKTSHEWIVQRTGIYERRVECAERSTSDMAVSAILDLVRASDLQLESIDAIIVASSTGDQLMPSTAHVVCAKLCLSDIFAFDVNAACSGFVYALTVGAGLIESGRYQNIVIVGADKMSSIVDINDRNTNVLFGDGAGAVWLHSSTSGGMLESVLLSSADESSALETAGGEKQYIRQDGRTVFKKAVSSMVDACLRVLERNNLSMEDIQWFVPHQANLRIVQAIQNALFIPESKILTNLQYLGNTGSASIPLCLKQYEHKFQYGDKILLTAFGAGFSWGATVVEWTS